MNLARLLLIFLKPKSFTYQKWLNNTREWSGIHLGDVSDPKSVLKSQLLVPKLNFQLFGRPEFSLFVHNSLLVTHLKIRTLKYVHRDHTEHLGFQEKSDFDL